MNALFVLLPRAEAIQDLLAAAPARLQDSLRTRRHRRYPPATDAAHLHSLVCAMGDQAATTWIAGVAKSIAIGAVLGGITNGILAGCFDMLGGLLPIAIPLGCAGGAFLGGFSAAMRGTATPRPEVLSLLPHVHAGCVLVSWSGGDFDELRQMHRFAADRGLPAASRT